MRPAPATAGHGARTALLLDEVRAAFAQAYGEYERPSVAVAPGRVNLIGEHTDYNDGFVLPMAIERHVAVAYTKRTDGRIEATAPDMGGRHLFDPAELDPQRERGWVAYIAGVFRAMRQEGLNPPGLRLVVQGNVPIGAGLSSSAALELAVARALCDAGGIEWDPVRMALLAQKAEREYVGVSCGIMDQLASSISRAGHALLLDCRSLETRPVPIPAEAVVVVMDTGVRRTLEGSAYNERFRQCQDAVAVIRSEYGDVASLRDVSATMLAEVRTRMDPVTFRRARHVIDETQRPPAMADALARGDLRAAGRLMNDSHASLRDLYEVSSSELDAMVEAARRHPACLGARLTGAGFGGCAVALVERTGADDFIGAVGSAYAQRFPHTAELFACEPASGAAVRDPAPTSR